jgi:hypothetical protein
VLINKGQRVMSIYRMGNRAKTMFQETVPDRLVGLWRRLSIEENGQRDTTTQVFWLQTTSGFGDIRIPAGRPAVNTLAELTSAQAIALAHQGGFVGITRLEGDRCEWHHAMDYQPFNGKSDVGTLHWEGDILIEIGPNGVYKEEWQRVATGPTATMTLAAGAGWKGWLVLCGDRFIYMCEHRTLLPSADSLTALLSAASDESGNTTATISHQDQQYLNCEISFGRVQQGGKPWEIELSTLPWKEGNSLWNADNMTVDYPNEKIIQTVGAETLAWTVQEWGELEQLFGKPSAADLLKANLPFSSMASRVLI